MTVSDPQVSSARHHRRFALWVLLGVSVLQAIWIVAVPPFRASDEFDHVYRAAGIMRGEWTLDEPAADGRGQVVTVPSDVVKAAEGQCTYLEYTGRDNCYAIESAGEGLVHVASAAGQYHPAYYAVIGSVPSLFGGAGYDYALRIAAAVFCSLGIALAALVWARGGDTSIERFGFLLCLTPIFVYSSVIPAPNGPEMVAGLVVWCALLRLTSLPPHAQGRVFVVAAVAAGLLVTFRYLGPLWLGLIVVTVVVFHGWSATTRLVSAHKRVVVLSIVAVTLATAMSAAWTLRGTFLGVQEDTPSIEGPLNLGAQPFVWLLQIVGAFPLRGDASPFVVYVIYLLVLGAMLLAAGVLGRWRERAVLVLSVVVVVALPIVLTAATYRTHGVIWQGRYGLAYAVGVALMASVVIARGAPRSANRELPRLVMIGSGLLGGGHAIAIGAFLVEEQAVAPSMNDEAWLNPPVGLVVAATAGTWLLLGLAAGSRALGGSQAHDAAGEPLAGAADREGRH